MKGGVSGLLVVVYRLLMFCLCVAYMWLTLCLRFATDAKLIARCEGRRFGVACGGVPFADTLLMDCLYVAYTLLTIRYRCIIEWMFNGFGMDLNGFFMVLVWIRIVL